MVSGGHGFGKKHNHADIPLFPVKIFISKKNNCIVKYCNLLYVKCQRSTLLLSHKDCQCRLDIPDTKDISVSVHD